MAYKDGFVIEYVDKQPTRLSCRVCAFLDADKSCSRRGLYVPSIGYDNWKYCDDFRLSGEYDDCDILQARYQRYLDRRGVKQVASHCTIKKTTPTPRQKLKSANRVRANPITVGTEVEHKRYGCGYVAKIKDGKIAVDFEERRILLPYPDCIAKGELRCKETD